MLHAYCIVPAGHEPAAGLTGCAGEPVQAIAAGGRLACWVSPARTAPADAGMLRDHNRVVAAAMDRRVTPVPLRFGQRFPDAPAAAAAIAAGQDRWLGLLDRFAGRAEYGVRVVSVESVDEGPPDAARDVQQQRPASGRAYMAALAARQAADTRRREEAGRIAALLSQCAGPAVVDSSMEVLEEADGVVAVAHLVAWDDADAYHAAMQGARDALQDLRCLFTGPWPPYSFVA